MSTTILAGCSPARSGDAAGKTDFSGSEGQEKASGNEEIPDSLGGVEHTGSLPLLFAEKFRVDYYGDDFFLVSIDDEARFLVVREGKEAPAGIPSDIPVYCQPFSRIYLASSQTMDFFRRLDCLDLVRMTSTKAQDWSLPDVRERVEKDEILYVGKYNSPDYERLISEGCDLCVENTMIYHDPEARELIEKLSIPVFVEKSSYEEDPLGRMEWIRLYGCLTGKEKEADSFFSERVTAALETIAEAGRSKEGEAGEGTGNNAAAGTDKALETGTKTRTGTRTKTKTNTKTVAFFYVTANGQVNIRKPGDYISRMIELAGGEYIFSDMGTKEGEGSGGSSITISAEEFYDKARDADILIYNSTIGAELETMEELIKKSPLLADFRAVKEGNVWGTEKDLFQEITGTADMIRSLSQVIHSEDPPEVEYMHRLL